MMKTQKRLLLNLPDAQHRALKIEAAARGISMKALIMSGLKIGGILPAIAPEIRAQAAK